MHRIVFCGSTSDSVLILEALRQASVTEKITIVAVVTQPPKPVGRKKIITPTPVQQWAEKNNISILTFPQEETHAWKFADEQAVTNSIMTCKPDLLITAVFGQKIPKGLLAHISCGGINIHPSLLPRWRGADPMPWTILSGDAQTGVTISRISDVMDEGDILAQKKYPVTEKDTPDALRTTLFTMGATLLISSLPSIFANAIKPIEQKKEDITTARKLGRNDGYIPWEILCDAMIGKTHQETNTKTMVSIVLTTTKDLSLGIERIFRALSPWPGIWTTIETAGMMRKTNEIIGKRLKLLNVIVRDHKLMPVSVQIEGKTPISWEQFSKAYLT
jgi:methionyl-tRNA formyltransferase